MAHTDDRRRHPRQPIGRPVKMQCDDTGRYYAGRTIDVSAEGLLVELADPARVRVGQAVRLAVGWSARQVVLARQAMVAGRVVRRSESSGGVRVGIALACPQRLAA